MEWVNPFNRPRPDRATVDFETRSELPIRTYGAWLYSVHPTTSILCLSFMLPGDSKPSLYHTGYRRDDLTWEAPGMLPGSPRKLEELFFWIAQGGLVEAHNSTFERYIWENIFTKKGMCPFGLPDARKGIGAPRVKPEQWRCSAAKAAAWSLPRALNDACMAALDKDLKDAEGKKVMQKLASPRKARKNENPRNTHWLEDESLSLRLFAYCNKDVLAEHALSAFVPDLSERETAIWIADQNANARGVRIDIDLCEAAVLIDREIKRKWNAELYKLTGIKSGTLRAEILAWLQGRGHEIEDTKALTLDRLIERTHDPLDRRVAKLARNLNRTSTAKYKKALQLVDLADERIRDLVMYHGANTGRWSGKGLQVQNFPRGDFKSLGVTLDEAVEIIKTRDIALIESRFEDPLEVLSWCARGILIASEGKDFITGDYSAIEARMLFWAVDCQSALDIYRAGLDLYCDMATDIYRRPITRADEKERFFGKTAILSLGFGVGFLTFALKMKEDLSFTVDEAMEIMGDEASRCFNFVRRMLYPVMADVTFQYKDDFHDLEDREARLEEILKKKKIMAKASLTRIRNLGLDPAAITHELALSKYVVDKYRGRFPEVREFWYDMEDAAKRAIRNPGKSVECKKYLWRVERGTLFLQLPTGKHIVYNKPFLKDVETPDGEKDEQIRFYGVHKKIRKWLPMGTYGASTVENAIQASAREVTAYNFLRTDQSGKYIPCTTVHDEFINEIDQGMADVEEFEAFMAHVEPCFAGCPIEAEGATFRRYRK